MTGTLAILGPGTLGRSLAGWAALRGYSVRLAGRNRDHAEAARAAVEARWGRATGAGRLDPAALAGAAGRLEACPDWDTALDGAHTVLEALPESMELKAEAWGRIGAAAPSGALLLTGSSALPVGELAARSGLDGRLLGFHLFVPVDRMAVVELVVPDGVPESVAAQATAFGEALGQRVVRVRDQAGYAASRMALAQGLEAMRLLEAGVASAQDLDALMMLGYGHPVGPLELSDRVGLDLRLAIAESLFSATHDARFAPPAILRDHVAHGRLGRKTGRGFLEWTPRTEAP